MKKLFLSFLLIGLIACQKETMTTTVTLQPEGKSVTPGCYYEIEKIVEN